MYAVIKTGGKQQKVKVGDVIEVEKIVHDGETMTFHPILVVDDDGKTHVGAEAAKAVVTAKPLGEKKGDKVKSSSTGRRAGTRSGAGTASCLTMLEIEDVKFGAAPKRATRAKAEPKTEAPAEAPVEAGPRPPKRLTQPNSDRRTGRRTDW